MTIEEFASILEEFISEYDSVLVSGLGVFHAKLEPAEITDRGFAINPPYRSLSFVGGKDSSTSAFDLGELYSSKYRKQSDSVADELQEVVREIHNSLASESECVLQGIGTLRLIGGEWPVLIPDMSLDIYPEGFGLESVSLKNRQGLTKVPSAVSVLERAAVVKAENVHEKQDEGKVEEKEQVKTEEEKPVVRKKHPWRWVWISLLVLCVLLVAAFFLMARFAPDILDTLLYTPEQLEIIHSVEQ